MKRRNELDPEEKDIEARSAEYVSVQGEKRAKIERILDKAKKARNINIRISEQDLVRLKKKAEDEGIPYQTMIASILHKYLADRLLDEKDVLKSLRLLESVR